MKDFLKIAREKYYLSIGKYRFSPIMEASIALSLAYRKTHLTCKQDFPFYLSFPDKSLASVWLSVSLLTNFFLEDYVYQVGKEKIASFKKGDKIEIFGAVAVIENISSERIFLRFSDQGSIPINKLRVHLNATKRTSLNKFQLFSKKFKEANKNRNLISRILEPDEPIIINENYLSSKVLLITGRGNTKQLRSILNDSLIYNKPLSNVFIENKNLVIKKDLETFKNFYDHSASDKEKLFKELFLNFLNSSVNIDPETTLTLKTFLQDNKYLTQQFKDAFDDLVDLNNGNYPELENINNLYPGVREEIPENIKAVVINEIGQIDLYKTTINGFLSAGIPVYVISNRYVQKTNDLIFLNDFFHKNIDAYRINWNRKKINSLNISDDQITEYLDNKLWKSCLRYSKQNIKINVANSVPLDMLLFQSQKLIKTLENYENLQEAYYKSLYPAAYLFKNSVNNSKAVIALTEQFELVLNKSIEYLEKPVKALLQEMVSFLKNATSSNKTIEDYNSTFSNLLPVKLDYDVYIPSNFKKTNIPDGNTQKILFSGYPYNEFFGHHLIDTVCFDFVPEIILSCWPIESELTYNYLHKRILAGYFTDNLHPNWKIPEEIILKDRKDFEDEVNTFLKWERKIDASLTEGTDQENDIINIANFKYQGYSNIFEHGNPYKVKCNILNFSDGSFLFLPKNSKILTQIETDDGSLKFKNSHFSELEIGFNIYIYKKDKRDFRELARNTPLIKNAFSELEQWKILLESLYLDNDRSLEKVESILFDTKKRYNLVAGNPTKHNIQRWLYDDELIAPDIENIRIILLGFGLKEIDRILEKIRWAKGKVDGYSISLSSKIKKRISQKISAKHSSYEKEFQLEVNNVQISVESRMIAELEKREIEIDYYNTRKILN